MLVCTAALWAATAHAEKVTRSALSGTLMSASAQIPASSSVVVFTTPAASTPPQRFVLTQACGTRRNRITLTGNTVGAIPLLSHRRCTPYAPGIVLPPNETLTCATTSTSPQNCMVTGELTR